MGGAKAHRSIINLAIFKEIVDSGVDIPVEPPCLRVDTRASAVSTFPESAALDR